MLQALKLLPLLVALAQGSGPICPFDVDEACCVTVGRSRRGISQRVLTVGVIGAGFGGLGAATRLSALGCRVQVIEARPRVGGRAETASVGGFEVDMGAAWLHGVEHHPLLPFIQKYNSPCDPSSWPDFDKHVCGPCKALVNWGGWYGSTCGGYCSGIGLTCVNGWEEEGPDGCTVKEHLGCDRSYGGYTSDAICECAGGSHSYSHSYSYSYSYSSIDGGAVFTLAATDYANATAYNASAKNPPVAPGELQAWESEWYDEVYPIVERMQDDTDEDASLASGVAAAIAQVGSFLKGAVLRFVLADEVALDSAADADDLSLWWWDSSEWLDDEVQDSADAILVPGYGVLAERIAGDLEAALWRSSWSDRGGDPETAFVLGDPVASVRVYRGRVVVTTRSGNPLPFDRVVVALPLGVLQAGAVAFSPPLGDAVEAALAARGAGVAEKYVLVFDRAWWPADAFLYTVEPDPLEWLNLERALGAPALACFTAGELALRLARLSEADLTAYLVGTLRRMFPRVENITVVATKFSNWHGDEFTRGGWSYVKPGADYPKNAEALERRILGGRGALAGEFVSAAYGTTSGAWDSGVRAAECVVGLGGCAAESDAAGGVPPTDRLLVVLTLAVAMLA